MLSYELFTVCIFLGAASHKVQKVFTKMLNCRDVSFSTTQFCVIFHYAVIDDKYI
jgi:hypothetical protein